MGKLRAPFGQQVKVTIGHGREVGRVMPNIIARYQIRWLELETCIRLAGKTFRTH